MAMTATEYALVTQYSASELAGALMLGKFARRTTNSYLRSKYTWHCMEEARHAWLWAELLEKEQQPLREVHDDAGDQYFTYFDQVKDDIDFLAFVHVYELRVPFHLAQNAKMTHLTDATRSLMLQLVKEEGPHLSWIADFLHEEQKNGNNRVKEAVEKFGKIEEKTYHDFLQSIEHAGQDFAELHHLITSALPEYGQPWRPFCSAA